MKCSEVLRTKVNYQPPKKMFYIWFLFVMVVELANAMFTSPCPDTFQYQMDHNGQLHGNIGVYSFDESSVKLDVQLSVADAVQNYNGNIQLMSSKNQVADDILNRQPIRYKLTFPQWERIPPKINKISVNGQLVCSGVPLSAPIVTVINLQHVLSISANPLIPKSTKPKNIATNPFLQSFITTTTTQTPPVRNSIPTNEVIYGGNPFLNRNPQNEEMFSNNPFLNRLPGLLERETQAPPIGRLTTPRSGTCGQPQVPNLLVVNGDSVQRGAFPWIVAVFDVVQNGLEYKCGGTLISPKHVLTAAHCVEKGSRRVRAEKLIFLLGKLNLQRWSQLEGELMVEADEIVVHPQYQPFMADADLAVAILSTTITPTKYIQPICLWAGSDDLELVIGQKGAVVGWGKDETGALSTAEPKQTNLPIVSQEQCLRSSDHYQALGITSNRTFCAGDRSGSGPCNGDSGSGLVMKRNNIWYLRGVVSISLSISDSNSKHVCDLSNYVVFTDVTKFKSWLSRFV